MPKPITSRLIFASAAAVAAALLMACGSSIKVRSDADPGVDMGQYQTYAFFSQMGIEGGNYSSLLGQHFREAIYEQMEARGYRQAETPQLQINVTVGAEEKIRVKSYQEPYLYGGYYGRSGIAYHGGPWGFPGATTTTVSQYTQANVYIDMVDASEHKLVWQGVATFTLTDKMQQNVRQSVNTTVAEVFTQFPIAPRAPQ